jgi:hypothetical protein
MLAVSSDAALYNHQPVQAEWIKTTTSRFARMTLVVLQPQKFDAASP